MYALIVLLCSFTLLAQGDDGVGIDPHGGATTDAGVRIDPEG